MDPPPDTDALSLELLSTTHPFRTRTPHSAGSKQRLLQLPVLRGLESKCPTTTIPEALGGVSFGPCPPLVYSEVLGRGGQGEAGNSLRLTLSPYRKSIFSDPPHPYSGRPGLPSSPRRSCRPQPSGFQAATFNGGLSLSEPLLSSGCPLLPQSLEPSHLPQGAGSPKAGPRLLHHPLKTWAQTLRTWRWCQTECC